MSSIYYIYKNLETPQYTLQLDFKAKKTTLEMTTPTTILVETTALLVDLLTLVALGLGTAAVIGHFGSFSHVQWLTTASAGLGLYGGIGVLSGALLVQGIAIKMIKNKQVEIQKNLLGCSDEASILEKKSRDGGKKKFGFIVDLKGDFYLATYDKKLTIFAKHSMNENEREKKRKELEDSGWGHINLVKAFWVEKQRSEWKLKPLPSQS